MNTKAPASGRQSPLLLLFLFLALAATSTSSPDSSSKPNILLITIDTLRADHLGCYGYKSETSPNLDRFAKEAVLFQNAYATVPVTLPSHATILSGLYPKNHGIRDNAHFPLTSKPLLQQVMKQHGYRTAAFVSGSPLSSDFGLSRGFDFYDDEFPGAERKANETTSRALQWLKEAPSPYFLWIHYFDPHTEYEPPAEFARKFPSSPYDGEIAFVDSEIGKVWSAVKSKAVTIITADHGESLGEHGETTHAVFLYNATLRVPLLIGGPGIKPEVRADSVSLTDIAPTVLALAGLTAAPADGVPLFAKRTERTLLAESLYAQRNFGYAPLYASIRENQKYILSPQPEFYDLRTDPAEKRNLIREKNTSGWKTALREYAQEERSDSSSALSPEELEKLRSLGYVGATVARTGADPKSKIDVIERFRQAMILLKTGRFPEAENSFRQITATEQHNGLAYRFLADALSAQQKYADAARTYVSSLERLPDPSVSVQLAKAYNKMRRPADAEKTLQDTIRQHPHFPEAAFELSSFYASQGKWDEAFRLLETDSPEVHNQRGILYLEKKEPANAKREFLEALRALQKAFYWNNLAIAEQRLGNLQEAEKTFRQALKLNPDYEECEANLAFLLVEQKRWEESVSHLRKITSSNPKLWRARFALAFALENQGQYREANEAYQSLLRDAPAQWPQRQQVEKRIQDLRKAETP